MKALRRFLPTTPKTLDSEPKIPSVLGLFRHGKKFSARAINRSRIFLSRVGTVPNSVQPAVRHFGSEAVEFLTVLFRPMVRNWHGADMRERFRLQSIEQNQTFLRMSAPSQDRRTFRFRIQCFWFPTRSSHGFFLRPSTRSSSGLRPEIRQAFGPKFVRPSTGRKA